MPVAGLKVPCPPDDHVQLVGLPVAVAVNWTGVPSHQGEAGLATMVGTSGIGLMVKEYVPWFDVPQAFVAVTVSWQLLETVTVGAVYVTVAPDPMIVPQEAFQLQLVGLPVAVAVNWDVFPEQTDEAGLAVIVGEPGFGLIVNE